MRNMKKAKVKVWTCPVCGEHYWSEADAYTHYLQTLHTNVEPTKAQRKLSDKRLKEFEEKKK